MTMRAIAIGLFIATVAIWGGLATARNAEASYSGAALQIQSKAASAAASGKPAPAATSSNVTNCSGTGVTITGCYLCRMVDAIATRADQYGGITGNSGLYTAVDIAIRPVWKVLFTIGFMVFFFLSLFKQQIDLRVFFLKAVVGVIITNALYHPQLFINDVYDPIVNFAGDFAIAALSHAGDVTVQTTASTGNGLVSPFAKIEGTMEMSMWKVVYATTTFMNTQQQSSGFWDAVGHVLSDTVHILLSIIMLLPYIAVMGVFTAYMVEAIFMFLGPTCIMPVLWILAFFDKGRSFLWIALRLYASAGLTMIFAGIAMGFTLFVVNEYTKGFVAEACQSITVAQTTDYWMCFFIGFASILLHLKAKTLATNFSGANDGAGPAAAIGAMGAAAAMGVGKMLMKTPAGAAAGAAAGMAGGVARGKGLGRLGGAVTGMVGGALAGGFEAAHSRSARDFLDGYKRRRSPENRKPKNPENANA